MHIETAQLLDSLYSQIELAICFILGSFWLITLYRVIVAKENFSKKIRWFLLVLLIPVIGALLYRLKKKSIVHKKNTVSSPHATFYKITTVVLRLFKIGVFVFLLYTTYVSPSLGILALVLLWTWLGFPKKISLAFSAIIIVLISLSLFEYMGYISLRGYLPAYYKYADLTIPSKSDPQSAWVNYSPTPVIINGFHSESVWIAQPNQAFRKFISFPSNNNYPVVFKYGKNMLYYSDGQKIYTCAYSEYTCQPKEIFNVDTSLATKNYNINNISISPDEKHIALELYQDKIKPGMTPELVLDTYALTAWQEIGVLTIKTKKISLLFVSPWEIHGNDPTLGLGGWYSNAVLTYRKREQVGGASYGIDISKNEKADFANGYFGKIYQKTFENLFSYQRDKNTKIGYLAEIYSQKPSQQPSTDYNTNYNQFLNNSNKLDYVSYISNLSSQDYQSITNELEYMYKNFYKKYNSYNDSDMRNVIAKFFSTRKHIATDDSNIFVVPQGFVIVSCPLPNQLDTNTCSVHLYDAQTGDIKKFGKKLSVKVVQLASNSSKSLYERITKFDNGYYLITCIPAESASDKYSINNVTNINYLIDKTGSIYVDNWNSFFYPGHVVYCRNSTY